MMPLWCHFLVSHLTSYNPNLDVLLKLILKFRNLIYIYIYIFKCVVMANKTREGGEVTQMKESLRRPLRSEIGFNASMTKCPSVVL